MKFRSIHPIALISLLFLSSCWNLDPVTVSTEIIPFTPVVGVSVDYTVQNLELPVFCPDGANASLTVVSPAQIEKSAPYALVFHSGALDYIEDPGEDPSTGEGYNANPHLTSAWAKRQIFTTLGMFESQDPILESDGILIASLVESGTSVIMPTNCWGDLWHNQSGLNSNDYVSDHFSREGRTVAFWAWDLLRDYENTSAILDVHLSTPPDDTQPILIGLGTGSRAIGELLNNWADPVAIMVDSAPDDIQAVAHDDKFLTALARIAPDDLTELDSGSLSLAPYLPPRVVVIYSPTDTRFPIESIQPLVNTVLSLPEGLVIEAPPETHLTSLTSAKDVKEAVYWLVTASAWDAPSPAPESSQFAGCVATESRQTDGDDAIDRIVVSTYDEYGNLYTYANDNDADGVYNTQEMYDADGNILELSTNTDDKGVFDRRELSYWEEGLLTRTEQDSGNDGDIDLWCDYTYTFDDIGRPIISAGLCDDDGDGTTDREPRTTTVYDYIDENDPLDEGTLAIGSFLDLESDGAIDSATVRVYDQGDAWYVEPLWVKYDENADGVHDETWKYTYSNGLLTNFGYDENADGDMEWREQYEYDSASLLLKTLEDDGGDGTWNNNWQYTYIDNYIDIITYDIAQDNDIEETWTTEWSCP